MRKLIRRLRRGESGMATMEFAVLTIAAVALAMVMVTIVRSAAVHTALTNVVVSAISQVRE
jgi:Flp pilus assembly pilin Flp